MRYLRITPTGIWTFRYRIPERFRWLFEHRHEIKRSLGRVSKTEAIAKGLQLELELRTKMATDPQQPDTTKFDLNEDLLSECPCSHWYNL